MTTDEATEDAGRADPCEEVGESTSLPLSYLSPSFVPEAEYMLDQSW